MRAATTQEIFYLTEMLKDNFNFGNQEADDVYALLDFLENVDVPHELRNAIKLKISRAKNPLVLIKDTEEFIERKKLIKTKAEEFAETLIANS